MPTADAPPIRDILRQVWGFDDFRPLQDESIRCVLDRRDSVTVLPTGGGKSLCFQAPAIRMPGMAVVVSPLISLMKDQVDALVANGVEAAFINSTQSDGEKRLVAEKIRRGDLKFLYVAPERLLTPRTLDFLATCEVSFFAIDEAHCISNWGHDFRPEYRGLCTLKDRFPGVGVHAYTATASRPVRDDIAAQLALRNAEILVGDFDRPNLTYRMLRSAGKMNQIVEVIDRHRGEAGIVYCISRKEVERTAATLGDLGHKALPYHAGLSDEQRKSNQDDFIKERSDIIVATVAFGMGIDKSNVRYVIHAGMPKSIEHYQQESGRAGRDGLESECVLIYSGGDVVTWKRIMEMPGDFLVSREATDAAFRSLDAIYDLCSAATCRHKSIVQYFGQTFRKDNCGACDVCLGESDLVDDPLILAQKIISCVYRLEQRFGAAHTAKVLVGSTEARLIELGHDKLSTYALLTDHPMAAVRQWIDQLVGQGFIERTGEYQTLSITPSGFRVLKGHGTPTLTVAQTARPRRSGSPSGAAAVASWEGVDRGLFESLRALRSDLAGRASVPAYVVFSDATLRELARAKPSSLDEFADIKGVGQKKLTDYGEVFLKAIDAFCRTHEGPGDEASVSPAG